MKQAITIICSEAKISNFKVVLVEEDIFRFYIAMSKVSRMNVVQSLEQLLEEITTYSISKCSFANKIVKLSISGQ